MNDSRSTTSPRLGPFPLSPTCEHTATNSTSDRQQRISICPDNDCTSLPNPPLNPRVLRRHHSSLPSSSRTTNLVCRSVISLITCLLITQLVLRQLTESFNSFSETELDCGSINISTSQINTSQGFITSSTKFSIINTQASSLTNLENVNRSTFAVDGSFYTNSDSNSYHQSNEIMRESKIKTLSANLPWKIENHDLTPMQLTSSQAARAPDWLASSYRLLHRRRFHLRPDLISQRPDFNTKWIESRNRTFQPVNGSSSQHPPLSLMQYQQAASGTVRMQQQRKASSSSSPLISGQSPPVYFAYDQHESVEPRRLVYAGGLPDRETRLVKGNEQTYPVLSIQYIEPLTIELLVVVTERMHRSYNVLLNDYLYSTITTVASLLRHPTLKTPLQISITDVILLGREYPKQPNLEDWSYSKQEQVMARFCRWVNGLRSPNYTWDSAILLNIGHFKSTALGVAHYRSMCNEESSCLAVLDRGFGTAYIMAHELGHQLGAKHDFEANSNCGKEEQQPGSAARSILGTNYDNFYYQPELPDDQYRRDTIMSGTLYFDNFPLRWSACSRQEIHRFVQGSGAVCLKHTSMPTPRIPAEDLAKVLHTNLPGAVFDLNQQCVFVLKAHNTQFCGQMLPPCRQLHCQDYETQACIPMESAWAEGSTCGDNKWCIQGQCVPKQQKPIRVDGNWGEWSPWSACSRSCGGGVRFSDRDCNNPEPQNGGDFCIGTRTRMRSCGVKPCEKPVDIRQQQCNELGHNYRAYSPKLGEVTACSLTCLQNGHAAVHGMVLPDGSPCYSHRDDICIKGRCWETGCDGILGSDKKFDHCRVCGGDNSTCQKRAGKTKTPDSMSYRSYPRGLVHVLHIPRGVTDTFVRKYSPRKTPYSSDSYDDFMLLIFEELKTQIRRGESREPFAGAELYYSGSRYQEEIVEITGRLDKDVNIVIRVENSQTTREIPSLDYHYYVDNSMASDRVEFSSASASLQYQSQYQDDQQHQQADASKRATGNDAPVKDTSRSYSHSSSSSSSDVDREVSNKLTPINYAWRVSELPNGCSTCAGNITSYPHCYPVYEDDEKIQHDPQLATLMYRPMADIYCSHHPRPAPLFRRCADYCGVRWKAKPAPIVSQQASHDAFSVCTARCGEGHLHVAYVCEEYVNQNRIGGEGGNDGERSEGSWRAADLGDRACIHAGLGDAQSQPPYITCEGKCPPCFWTLSNWTQCSNGCGYGNHKRVLRCLDFSGYEWPLKECVYNAESPTHNQALVGSIGREIAEHLMAHKLSSNHVPTYLEHQMFVEEVASCVSIADCRQDLSWSTSTWSECRPLDAIMTSYCKTIDNDTLLASGFVGQVDYLVGLRQRDVTCKLKRNAMIDSLRDQVIDRTYVNEGREIEWRLNPNFCREASRANQLADEPIGREACNNPKCYRWDQVKYTQCSVTCGRGVRQASVPCESITLQLDATGFDRSKQKQKPQYWIEPVDAGICQEQLGYKTRAFVDSDRLNLYIETADKPIDKRIITGLREVDINGPIAMECAQSPCRWNVPVWHSTSWSSCSARCGHGKRTRQVYCMLETHEQESKTGRSKSSSTTFSASRLKATITSNQICLDAHLPKPSEEEACSESNCPTWVTEPWQECQGLCEFGIQQRGVKCVMRSDSSWRATVSQASSHSLYYTSQRLRYRRSAQPTEIEPHRCAEVEPMPEVYRLCQLPNGCPYWRVSDWSQCSVKCGLGSRQRQTECVYNNGSHVTSGDAQYWWSLLHNLHASQELRSLQHHSSLGCSPMALLRVVVERRLRQPCQIEGPIETAECKMRPCTGSRAFWWPVAASKCDSSSCQLGIQRRVVKCLNNRLEPTDEYQCDVQSKPVDIIPCVSMECAEFEWHTDPWSNCPSRCGSHLQYRRVRCRDKLGEEYTHTKCPMHLKPEPWRTCPDRCVLEVVAGSEKGAANPKTCLEVKQLDSSAKDGNYQLNLGLKSVTLYCADMESNEPKEYVILQKVNYAKTSAFIQPFSISSNSLPLTCPHGSSDNQIYSYLVASGWQSRVVDLPAQIDDLPTDAQTVSTINCPECRHNTELSSTTYYQRLRIDPASLRVDIEDVRFAYTIGPAKVPYATAKDCFNLVHCPQGQFLVDLRGTDFRVSVRTRWIPSFTNSWAHIYRVDNGQIINGRCGGDCAGCWPKPGLFFDLVH